MDNLEVSKAIDVIFDYLRDSNKYIDDTTPWSLAKDENSKDRLETVIFNLLNAICKCAILLQAFMPDTASNIFKQLGVSNTSYSDIDSYSSFDVKEPEVLFKRIEIDK